MSRAWITLSLVAVLGIFYVGAGLQSGPPAGVARGQDGVAASLPGPIGRYQAALGSGATERGDRLVVCDTTTGQCWSLSLTTTTRAPGSEIDPFAGGFPGGGFPARTQPAGSRWRDLGIPARTRSGDDRGSGESR